MSLFHRNIILFVILVLLVACSTTTPISDAKPISTQFSQPTLGVDESFERPPTITALPSSTPFPSVTPNQTQTARSQAVFSTQTAEQAAMASFPRLCKDNYDVGNFSPDGSWMAESCYREDDKSLILTISNSQTQDLWKLVYRDYIQQGENLPDGGMTVVYWSNDGRYVYFNSYVSGSGGECFVNGNVLNYGKGLFRLTLETGDIVAVLPLTDSFAGYDFSFSPTGRRLVYDAYSLGVNILDIKSGESVKVIPVSKFNGGGSYLWSSDGLKFLYSTVLYNEISEPLSYSVRLVDAQTGGERILLESPDNCFATKSWSDNNILTIESYDKNYAHTLIEYDLNANKIISEATATSSP